MSISGEVYSGGATTSQHVEAEDEDHFQNTTFKLKRTRSIGVLDEFIPDKLQENNIKQQQPPREEQPEQPIAFLNHISSIPSSNIGSYSCSSSSLSTNDESQPDGSSYTNNTEPIPVSSSASASAAPGPAPPVVASLASSSPVPSHTPSPLPLLQSPELLPHDDTDLMVEPSRHVDYLSYQWDVNDISKSWRYVISKKHNVANSARLENASWRTWAQRRQNLKTISPEVVNWSKDSDVTWLYGPILNDEHGISDDESCNFKRETTATSIVAGDISIANKTAKKVETGPKPILKKRTVQQSMISHSDLLKLQLASNKVYQKQRELLKQQQEAKKQEEEEEVKPLPSLDEKFFDYDTISAKLNKQYENTTIPENCEVVKLQDLINNRTNSKTKLDQIAIEAPMASLSLDKTESVAPVEEEPEEPEQIVHKEDRHIHFNEEVKQCIAVNPYSDVDAIPEEDEEDDEETEDDNYYNDYEEDEIGEDGYYENVANYYYDGSKSVLYDRDQDLVSDVEDEDTDDEGGFFIKVRSNSNAAPLVLGRTHTNDSISTSNSKVYKTIHLLPSTTLNYGSSDEESDDENPYTSSLSHNVNNEISRGYDYYYDYNTVYTVDPNHSIYGANYKNAPDVVDVPDNLGVGSNFDYEIIENDEMPPMVINVTSPLLYASGSKPNSPMVVTNGPAIPQVMPSPVLLANNPFHMSDDEEDSDDGLSIGTRRSSQALAESIFHTTSNQQEQVQHFPEKFLQDPEPVEAPISSINPRYSSTTLSKQPTSSHSLSQSFFDTTAVTPNTTSGSPGLSHAFFDRRTPSPVVLSSTPESTNAPLTRTLSNKTSPLPPQTTSETALFKSSSGIAPSKNIFSFDDDSEEEEEQDVSIKKTYTSLSQVADKSGIRTPSPVSSHSDEKGVMGQAKGLAKHFFG
ncbi:Resistance to glucose repression protein 1 [Spathaspora sp. JA1]|nr:Resistance to glucose repression protein 1 [Spathaspora sp. JA1]